MWKLSQRRSGNRLKKQASRLDTTTIADEKA
jgi:hypothetical protein